MKPKALLVSHDAGGAEVLASWYRKNKERYRFYFVLGGPAPCIFQRDFHEVSLSGLEIMRGFGREDFVLTATSLEADLERKAIAMARQNGVHCITFLDHWDLYRERFGNEESWHKKIPDEIWVGDEYAYEYAVRQGFPTGLLTLVENPYFEAIKAMKDEIQVPPPQKDKILYICEPISRKLAATFGKDASSSYHDELGIMECFLEELATRRDQIEAVTIRLHPSEGKIKYRYFFDRYKGKLPLSLSTEMLLVQDIMKHSFVVGIESNALVIGVLLGKAVYSCITGKQWKISLPHKEIRIISGFHQLFC